MRRKGLVTMATFGSDDDVRAAFGLAGDELVEAIIDGYLLEYPSSRSATMSRDELVSWTCEELDELFDVMRGGPVIPRTSLVFSGDMVKQADPTFAPLENFLEGKAFVGRMLATLAWQSHEGAPRTAQEILTAIESATLKLVKANMQAFSDTRLVSGCLTSQWEGLARRGRPHRRLERSEGSLETGVGIGSEAAPQVPVSREMPGVVFSEGLTGREVQVMALAARGYENGEIAQRLGIARNTVKNHLARLYAKTGTGNRTELARWAMEHGIG